VDPALTPVGAKYEPVAAAAFQEQDLVAAIEDAYLGRPQFIRGIQQPHQPVPNLAAFVTITRLHTAGREREARRLRHGPQRIRPANLL
jgi:hypothetical protein